MTHRVDLKVPLHFAWNEEMLGGMSVFYFGFSLRAYLLEARGKLSSGKLKQKK